MTKFKAGDKVRMEGQTDGVIIEVLFVGERVYLYRSHNPREGVRENTLDIRYVDSHFELFVEPLKETFYLNVYKDDDTLFVGHKHYDSVRDAEEDTRSGTPVGRVKVEIVEGKFEE
jgi:hypothetical protein